MRAGAFVLLVAAAFPACLTGCAGYDTEAVYPITEARGLYTIRVAFYRSWPPKGIDALTEANKNAILLRRAGHEAYVTNLNTLAIVTVGMFNDVNDPRLKSTWRPFFEEWGRKAGQTTLGKAQQEFEKWYGEDTPLGSRPWGTPVIPLQLKMKRALGTATEADEERYRKYLEEFRSTKPGDQGKQ